MCGVCYDFILHCKNPVEDIVCTEYPAATGAIIIRWFCVLRTLIVLAHLLYQELS